MTTYNRRAAYAAAYAWAQDTASETEGGQRNLDEMFDDGARLAQISKLTAVYADEVIRLLDKTRNVRSSREPINPHDLALMISEALDPHIHNGSLAVIDAGLKAPVGQRRAA